ncbi:YceI family protein [Ferruginivarius sediminum]|nr:YceI family protein [Ferruginivarius sediminum]
MRFLAVVFVLFLATAPALAQVPKWNVDHAESRVGFTAWQSGTPVPGAFESFKADIRFDRDRPEESSVDVRIDIASVSTGSMDRDQTIKSPSLFHAREFPTARFKADSFVRGEGDTYIAQGELTMRGETHPVDLPFNLQIDENVGELRAVADGEVTVQRLRWGIGQGQWEDTSMVPNDVRIEIRIVATRPVD